MSGGDFPWCTAWRNLRDPAIVSSLGCTLGAFSSMGVDRKTTADPTLYTWVAPNWRLGELSVVIEIPHESLALEVWRAIGRVRLWAESEPGRENLFPARPEPEDAGARRAEAQAKAPEIAGALHALSPRSIPTLRTAALVRACRQLSDWAEERGFLETAVQAVEAAAALRPEDPALANAAGRVCRRSGASDRAELWYARAIGLARDSQNRREYASAHLGAAAVMRDAGHHSQALRWIRRAADTARREGLRGKAAEAFHDALGVAALDQNIARAAFYARRALALYPIHHKRFPAFAYDIAFLLVNLGIYATALSLLHSVVGRIPKPAEQLVVWGTLARAAGGAGQRQRFYDALQQALSLAPAHSFMASGALYSAGEGARLLGDWLLAEELAHRALILAREHSSVVVVDLSAKLLAEASERLPGIPPAERKDPRTQVLRDLAAEVRLRLARWRGPTWRPRRASGDE